MIDPKEDDDGGPYSGEVTADPSPMRCDQKLKIKNGHLAAANIF